MADRRRPRPVRHLKRADPVLATVIEAVGPCRIQLRTDGTHFQALTRSIVFQQLSGKAASDDLSRFNDLYAEVDPDARGGLGDERR